MTLTDPYEIITPPGSRPIGQAPFWHPGATVIWTFRRFDFALDRAEVARPMRVIADGPDGAVLWLAGGTATRETRILGWEDTNPHDVPLSVRFRPSAEAPRRVIVDGTWHGAGVLKIVPPESPFSVWVLLREDAAADDGVRTEWYVNLEATHRRSVQTLLTSDHILDITFPVTDLPLHAADGRLDSSGAVFKDVDELAAAATYGAWPQQYTETIRNNGAYLLDHLGEHSWAFDPEWEVLARTLAAHGPPGDPPGGGHDVETLRNQEHRSIPNGCYDRQSR